MSNQIIKFIIGIVFLIILGYLAIHTVNLTPYKINQTNNTIIQTLKPTIINETSGGNWTGYGIYNQNISKVTGTFQIPAIPDGRATNRTSAKDTKIWVGIGGFNDNNIVQAGIEFTGRDSFYNKSTLDTWYETFCRCNYADPYPVIINNTILRSGDWITVTISRTNRNTWNIYMYNNNTNMVLMNKTISNFTAGNSAEWIVEKATTYNGLYYPYNMTTFKDNYYYTNSTKKEIIDTHFIYHITDGNTTLGAITNNTFNITYHS